MFSGREVVLWAVHDIRFAMLADLTGSSFVRMSISMPVMFEMVSVI